jgi:hypothetical protein
MLMTEWKLEDALVVEREEGREEGRENRNVEILELLNAGYSIDELKKKLSTSVSTDTGI